MNKRALASSAAVFSVLFARVALAQPQSAPSDSPQWLKDRRYNEGAGILAGDLELHPGIAGEFGYDSNPFLRTSQSGTGTTGTNQVVNGSSGGAPIESALVLRVTPSFYVSTLGPERKEGYSGNSSVNFRAGANVTCSKFLGVDSGLAKQDDPDQESNCSIGADLRLDILPGMPVGGSIFAGYTRVIQPNTLNADPDDSFNRDNIRAGGELSLQPGSGTLDWHLGYEFDTTLFEATAGVPLDTSTQEVYTRGRWRFRPRTALVYDGSLSFISYNDETRAFHAEDLVSAQPLRARLGLAGLVTERFAVTLMAGYGASFVDTSKLQNKGTQFDSVIGNAELKWYLAASPGIAAATDVGLALSSVAIGYNRDFALSYLSNYYGQDRGYLRFSYFFAGRMLATLEGGVSAIEYPLLVQSNTAGFTTLAADATLFAEYRFTDALGINATLKYSQTFGDQEVPVTSDGAVVADQFYALSWQRYEAYLGLRFFM